MHAVSGALPREEKAAISPADFAEFVDSRRDRAVRLAFRLLGGDAAGAEDAAQNAFVRAYHALGRFRGESSLDTWFYRILVREVHRYRRWDRLRRLWSRDREEPHERVDETPEGDPGLRRRIARALERLTTAQREVFVLVHLEGLTVSEAARVLDKAPGTLKSHLHRALRSLRQDLGDLRTTGKESRDETTG